MKKIYICLAGILASGFVMSQKVNDVPVAAKNSEGFIQKLKPGNLIKPKGATLWSDDMSDSTKWMMVNEPNGTPAHTCCDWTHSTNVNELAAQIAAGSTQIAGFDPLDHTTAANGFLIINSDAAGGGATQNATTYHTDTIDLSANPAVVMLFEQATRKYAEQYFVVYSTDAGASWNEVEVNTSYGTNTNSTNPEGVQVNMSSYIGGQDSVMIGFKYVGQWDWFWAVDDVSIAEPDDFDLSLDGAYWGATGTWGARLPYYQIPTAQVAPMDFSGIASNLGAVAQYNAVFHAHIGAYAGMSMGDTLTPGSSDTLDASTQWTPAATTGANVVDMWVVGDTTDSSPSNDSLMGAATINVTDFIYARDLGSYESGSYNQGEGFEAGNIFDIYQTADLGAIDVFVHPAANEGANFFVKLYSIDPVTGDFVYMDESNEYTITAADLGATVTLTLLNGLNTLNGGESYLVIAGSNGDGGATNDLVVGTAGVSEPQTTYYFDATDQTWYYSTTTTMVRMNFQDYSSINDVENNFGLSVYPNPSSNETTISFVADNEDVSIVITDMSGKEVYSSVSSSVSGTAKVSVNTAEFNSGVYVVKLTSNNSVAIKNLIVK
ncbi:MAG: T9SS type A sorting domain-containing protein [Crocinitomicaceae bacterium]|nr:T9SS type A sorting domain-containing protein [Crocinitomicaceae bacterium]